MCFLSVKVSYSLFFIFFLPLCVFWGGGAGWAVGEGSHPVQGPLAVTEELHLITFTLAYAYCGLELKLEVCFRDGGGSGCWGCLE